MRHLRMCPLALARCMLGARVSRHALLREAVRRHRAALVCCGAAGAPLEHDAERAARPTRRPSRRAQVVKHRADLATALVALGAAGALVDQVAEARGAARLPGVMALGFIGAFSETLALAVIAERGLARRPP